MFASPVAASAPGFDLSAGPLLPGVSNSASFALLVSVCECNPELTVCPVPVHESNIELLVLRQETINAPHVCPVNPVTATETFMNCLPFWFQLNRIQNCLPVQFQSANLLMNCLSSQSSPGKILMGLCSLPRSLRPCMLSLFCGSQFLQSLLWVPYPTVPSWWFPDPPWCSPVPPWCSSDPSWCSPDPSWSSPDPSWCSPDPSWSSPDPSWCSPVPPRCSSDPSWCSPDPSWCSPDPSWCSPALSALHWCAPALSALSALPWR